MVYSTAGLNLAWNESFQNSLTNDFNLHGPIYYQTLDPGTDINLLQVLFRIPEQIIL